MIVCFAATGALFVAGAWFPPLVLVGLWVNAFIAIVFYATYRIDKVSHAETRARLAARNEAMEAS